MVELIEVMITVVAIAAWPTIGITPDSTTKDNGCNTMTHDENVRSESDEYQKLLTKNNRLSTDELSETLLNHFILLQYFPVYTKTSDGIFGASELLSTDFKSGVAEKNAFEVFSFTLARAKRPPICLVHPNMLD